MREGDEADWEVSGRKRMETNKLEGEREGKQCSQEHVMADLVVLGHGVAHMAAVHVCWLCHYVLPFFSCLRGCDSLHQLFELGI